jgi:geranylgeranyl diphosphate synthase type II
VQEPADSESAGIDALRRRVEEQLEAYRAAAMPVLLGAIPQKEPRRHLYDLVPAYPMRAGKGLRPALCLATCRAFGGRMEDALDTAVAIELFHNAFLVHDDVEDDSETRRGYRRCTSSTERGSPSTSGTR